MSSRTSQVEIVDETRLGAAVASFLSYLQLESVSRIGVEAPTDLFSAEVRVDGVIRTAEVCEIIGDGAILFFSEALQDSEEDSYRCEYYAVRRPDSGKHIWKASNVVYYGDDSIWIANEAAMDLAGKLFPLAPSD